MAKFSDIPASVMNEMDHLGWLRYSRNAILNRLKEEVGEEGIKELRRFHYLKNKKAAIEATSKKLMEVSPKFVEDYNRRIESYHDDPWDNDYYSAIDYGRNLIYRYAKEMKEVIDYENEIIEVFCKYE